MELAKDCIDVGVFTNRIEEMRDFYVNSVKLPYEELLPIGAGVKQHRYGLIGSVLKLNEIRDPLPARIDGGYKRLMISDRRTTPFNISDPDGNEVYLVPSGHYGVEQIGLILGVTDPDAFDRFYVDALGCERIAAHRYRIGKSVLAVEHDPKARRAEKAVAKNAMEVVGAMRAVGIRYITAQVRNCNAEHKRFMDAGVWEGAPPVTLGDVARICFIRDPDGNWIEISQRASLTGPLPKD